MNVMMLITAINTGLVVQSDIRFDYWSRAMVAARNPF